MKDMKEYETALLEIKRFQGAEGKCKDYEDMVAGLIKQNIIDENMKLL